MINPDGTSLKLVSSDPTVLKVSGAPGPGETIWQVKALKESSDVDLVAQTVSPSGGVEDTLPVSVTPAANLGFTKVFGKTTAGPTRMNINSSDSIEVCRADLGSLVEFQVTPFHGSTQLMGKLQYTRELPKCSGEQSSITDDANGVMIVSLMPNDDCTADYKIAPVQPDFYHFEARVLPTGAPL